ncbi:NADP-dependent oxidoreductase [Kineosporia mesophila]|uniref:NADP-dependent oxidoreductase n=1 Tax=Kineosporia mesophila TaxID=566012 RepID=A0ABP6Z527_9ACTN|nr:NADP-dependent oxidoreductase [Kineosporia mesophila]
MFVVHYSSFGPPEVLRTGEAPEPHPGPGQIRIRVRAGGVTPVDAALRSGTTAAAARLELPHVPGVDAAGVVDEIGDAVTLTNVGDEVFGAVDVRTLGGANAQFAVLTFWSHRPAALPWHQAGAAGTSVETATRVLDRLKVRAGQTLLVDGAAGGVGSVVVQLAIARGLRVIGTARAENRSFVESLGAQPMVYGPDLRARVRQADVALDIAGKGSLPELIAITGSAQRVLSLADLAAPGLGVALSLGALAGEPGGEHGLAEAARLAVEGRFRVPLQEVFELKDAWRAHTLAEAPGPRRGKIALDVEA